MSDKDQSKDTSYKAYVINDALQFRTKYQQRDYERRLDREEKYSAARGRATMWLSDQIEQKNVIKKSSSDGSFMANHGGGADVEIHEFGSPEKPTSGASATSMGLNGRGAGGVTDLPSSTFTICDGGQPVNWILYGKKA